MTQAQNPFESDYATLHGTVPFDQIKFEYYEPTIRKGIETAKQEIEAICNNRATPDFENTIVALEQTGASLDKVLNVFYPLLSSLSDDNMMKLSVELSPVLSAHGTSIILNERLWEKVKYVYDHRDLYNLTPEDMMLLQRTYDSFADNGALLQGEDRETYKQLKSDLSRLTTLFGQNVLKELNTYEIWLTENDLAGLPATTVEGAKFAAKSKGRPDEYLFTLDQPVYTAVLKYSDRRDLREKFWRLYNGRNSKGEYSNVDVMKDIALKRLQLANLLGYPTYADYSLRHTMAENPGNVMDLLNRLRDAYIPAQRKEFAEIKNFAKENCEINEELMPWDYSYYANKLKKAKYDYDEEALRPYFELNNTIKGVFGLATKLYGLTFEENKEIPVYHPDVQAFEVKDSDGEYLGVIYTDFFPRESKRPGAWMTDFKPQWKSNGVNSRPHVSIVMNFTKPTENTPSCLTPYEVETFLHEFGHALHGLLANTKYKSLSGTNVYRDFVELPSQFNENYLTNKEFLDGFAKHYKTGEPIPAEEVQRIVASAQFGAAYACLRQLNFGYVDMAWHSITAPVDDAEAFEAAAGREVSMFAPVQGAMTSPQFSHIFSGGYAAGYYSYKWAEVLDADAFSMFEENGIFDRETARKFRDNVLSKGGTVNPAELYRQFRGRDATIDALLKRDGIEAPKASIAKENINVPKD